MNQSIKSFDRSINQSINQSNQISQSISTKDNKTRRAAAGGGEGSRLGQVTVTSLSPLIVGLGSTYTQYILYIYAMRCDCPVRSAEHVRSLYPLAPVLGALAAAPLRGERFDAYVKATTTCSSCFIMFHHTVALIQGALVALHVTKIHVAKPLLPRLFCALRCFYQILRSLRHRVVGDVFACYACSMLFAL